MALAMTGPRYGGEELLDVRRAASMLGVSLYFLRKWINQGTLPAQRLGQHWLLRRSDVEALVAHLGAGPAPFIARTSHRQVLNVIAETPGIHVADIAARLGKSRRSVLGYVQDLDQAGLVERRATANPRLPQPCYLTEAGSQPLAEAGPSRRKRFGARQTPGSSSVAFKVNREQADLLDRVVKKTVATRSEVIRAALRHYLPELEEAPKAS